MDVNPFENENIFISIEAKNTKLSDRQVLVLDGAPKFKGFNADKYGNRVYAINKGTVSLMESIGVWDKIVNVRCQPVKQMQVWGNVENLEFGKVVHCSLII